MICGDGSINVLGSPICSNQLQLLRLHLAYVTLCDCLVVVRGDPWTKILQTSANLGRRVRQRDELCDRFSLGFQFSPLAFGGHNFTSHH